MRPGKLDHRQVEHELDPVLRLIDARFVAGRVAIPVVAREPRAHGQQIPQRQRAFPGVGIRVGLVGETLQHDLVITCQVPAIDGNADEGGHDALGRRPHLVDPVTSVLVEILFNHEPRPVDQDAVNVSCTCRRRHEPRGALRRRDRSPARETSPTARPSASSAGILYP